MRGEGNKGKEAGKSYRPGPSYTLVCDSMVSSKTAMLVDQNAQQSIRHEDTISPGRCEEMVRSLVFNHLKNVSPILAEEFGTMFHCMQNSLPLQDVINHYDSTGKPKQISGCRVSFNID